MALSWRTGYSRLARGGEISERSRRLDQLFSECTLCPRRCGVDRRSDLGECATGPQAVVASWSPHHGEEPVISCRRGSGTVFLANCNLRCVFCQNHDISQRPRQFATAAISDEELASIFIELQDRGCHNINWVSPSHQVPQLVRALNLATQRGLSIPIVYNSNGYDSVETLRLLDGIVDIYMPDLKYADPDIGCRLSKTDRLSSTGPRGPQGDVPANWKLVGSRPRRRTPPGTPDQNAGAPEQPRWNPGEHRLDLRQSLTKGRHLPPRPIPPAHRVPGSTDLVDLDRGISKEEWQEAVAALEEHMQGDRHHMQTVF